jgi:hypothetical protein
MVTIPRGDSSQVFAMAATSSIPAWRLYWRYRDNKVTACRDEEFLFVEGEEIVWFDTLPQLHSAVWKLAVEAMTGK